MSTLRLKGVNLWVQDNKLRYEAPKGALTAAQIAKMRLHRDEIIAFLENARRIGDSLLAPIRSVRPIAIPLSYAQERLWFLDRIEALGPAYNNPAVVRLLGGLNVSALERAFAVVVERHEGLRTRFVVRDGNPVQEIDPAGAFKL